MPNSKFPDKATLSELQSYIKNKCSERGFDRASDLETYLLFSEEAGELARAIRRHRALFQEGAPASASSLQANLGEELADILSYLLELANRFQIDLEEAFRAKAEINEGRQWHYPPSRETYPPNRTRGGGPERPPADSAPG